MNRLLAFVLVAVTLAAATLVIATVPMLPERVATHFGWGGRANGFMTRDGYLWFMLAFTVALPWIVYGACALMSTGRISMRNAAYWLAPERREATIDAVRRFGALTALLVAVAVASAHLAVLEANRHVPPRLDEPVFLIGVALFVVAIVALSLLHARRFRLPPHALARR
jgi:uncharacterized membrane protein